jgi:hypothetical protein
MPEHQHTNKRKRQLEEMHQKARERAAENYLARRFYQEEEK